MLTPTLLRRSNGHCELCTSEVALEALAVPPGDDRLVVACAVCRAQITGTEPLDPRHWFALQQSAWSEVPAVQVVAWRLLGALSAEGWARDLLDQLYLDDEVLAWARSGSDAPEAAAVPVDSHGTPLANGDSVSLVKDLDVKGAAFTAKRGTVVKNIRLTDDAALVEGRVNGMTIVLKTEFLKKVG